LTPADAQLSLTYHIGIILVPVLATCVAVCAQYETSPLILLITRAMKSINFPHLALLVWGGLLVAAAIRLAKPEFASAKPELTTQQRKVNPYIHVYVITYITTCI